MSPSVAALRINRYKTQTLINATAAPLPGSLDVYIACDDGRSGVDRPIRVNTGANALKQVEGVMRRYDNTLVFNFEVGTIREEEDL